jgi:hypothetical protein
MKKATRKLTFNREVLDGQVILPVVGQRLVELSILLIADIVRGPGPDGLGLVQLLVLCVLLLDLLFLLLVLVLVLLLVLHILNLGLLLLLLFLLLLWLGLVVRDLFLALLLYEEPDGIADELGVLLDDLLDLPLLQVLSLILLWIKNIF